jgi:ABC-type transporter MlaC component
MVGIVTAARSRIAKNWRQRSPEQPQATEKTVKKLLE